MEGNLPRRYGESRLPLLWAVRVVRKDMDFTGLETDGKSSSVPQFSVLAIYSQETEATYLFAPFTGVNATAVIASGSLRVASGVHFAFEPIFRVCHILAFSTIISQRFVFQGCVLTVLSRDAVTKTSASCAQQQSHIMRAWDLSAATGTKPA